MEYKDILMLIRSHYENNEEEFKNACLRIAHYFDDNEEFELADFIMTYIFPGYNFIPMCK